MKADKDLMRELNYKEALGSNYSEKPYSLINIRDQSHPVSDTEFYSTREEAHERAEELDWEVYLIADLNADWR